MARKQKQAPKSVRLVSANGTRVRVAEDEVDKYKARGFKPLSGGSTASK